MFEVVLASFGDFDHTQRGSTDMLMPPSFECGMLFERDKRRSQVVAQLILFSGKLGC